MSWLRKGNEKHTHRYVEERLSAFLDGELSPKERSAVESHLATCQSCQWNLDTLQQTIQWTRELPTVPVPRVFTIPAPAQPVPAPRRRWTLPVLQGATALVAILLFFVAAGDFMRTGSPPGSLVSQEEAARKGVASDAAEPTVWVEATPGVEAEVEKAALAVTEEVEEVAAEAPPSLAPGESAEAEPVAAAEATATAPPDAGGMGIASFGTPEGEVEEPADETKVAAPAPSTRETTDAEAETVEPAPTPPPPPTVSPTVAAPTMVAEALEPRAPSTDEQDDGLVDRAGDSLSVLLGIAEIVLAAAFVLLLTATVAVMIRQRRTQ